MQAYSWHTIRGVVIKEAKISNLDWIPLEFGVTLAEKRPFEKESDNCNILCELNKMSESNTDYALYHVKQDLEMHRKQKFKRGDWYDKETKRIEDKGAWTKKLV